MKTKIILLTLLLNTYVFIDASAQGLPLVYNVENTGADCPIPYMPTLTELPSSQPLPDPFEWADGRGQMTHYSDWRYKRAEIAAQIQNYEIGIKPPRPDTITASFSRSDSMLRVYVTKNGRTLTLTSKIILPAGPGPFPAIIGMNSPSGSLPSTIFSSRNIAQIPFMHNQVTTYYSAQNSDPYYQLYGPALNLDNTGQYSAWAWGVSRLIDGLELVQDSLPIDLSHLAVTGCSYAGKMALFAGAFDERIALTLAMESGGGGATSWRYSHSEPAGSVEDIDNTNYDWFKNSMHDFYGDNVWRLPEDHHELMALVAPRALYVTGNPDYTWLSNPSCYICSASAQMAYIGLGIADRFGYSIIGSHTHCAVPDTQINEVSAFVDKFLLGNNTVDTYIADNPYSIDYYPWFPWTLPTVTNGTSFYGRASLIFPSNLQIGMDSTVVFQWTKVQDAERYFIQVSQDPTFSSIEKSDSTTADTVKTITGLLTDKKYFWRVQAKSAVGSGPWSEYWNFITTTPTARPQLIDVTPVAGQPGYAVFRWNQVKNANKYYIQVSRLPGFIPLTCIDSTTDTIKTLHYFNQGQMYYWRVQAKGLAGLGAWSDTATFSYSTSVKREEGGLPTEYSLNQNYPNPFNPTTIIKFGLPQRALTKIVIYDLLGREFRTLVDKDLEAGYYEITLDAVNFPSGTYFYRIQSGNFVQTKKMILLK